MKAPPSQRLNLVFDMGQVLIRWQPLPLLRQHLPTQCPDDASAQAWSQKIFHSPEWQEFDAGRISLHEVVTRTAQRTQLPAATLAALVQDIPRTLTPIEASVQVLQTLRDMRDMLDNERGQTRSLRLYFLSNMPAPFALELQQLHDFFSWFDGGVFSGLVHLAKPEPAIFQHTQAVYDLTPEHTVFIDDYPSNIAAAQAHGWRAVHLRAPELLGEVVEGLLAASGTGLKS